MDNLVTYKLGVRLNFASNRYAPTLEGYCLVVPGREEMFEAPTLSEIAGQVVNKETNWRMPSWHHPSSLVFASLDASFLTAATPIGMVYRPAEPSELAEFIDLVRKRVVE